MIMSIARRCDLLPSLLDLLDFMAEQIEMAKSNADRAAALSAASGAVPFFNSRVWENDFVTTNVMLSQMEHWTLSPNWRENWSKLVKEPADQFVKSVDDIIAAVCGTKSILESILSAPSEP